MVLPIDRANSYRSSLSISRSRGRNSLLVSRSASKLNITVDVIRSVNL